MASRQVPNLNELPRKDMPVQYVILEKDNKTICHTRCTNLTVASPRFWSILEFRPTAHYCDLELPCCQLYPEPSGSFEEREWGKFIGWIYKKRMVAIVESESCELYILPPKEQPDISHVQVFYRMKNRGISVNYQEVGVSGFYSPIESKSITESHPRQNDAVFSKPNNDHHHARSLKLPMEDVDSPPCEYVGDSSVISLPIAAKDKSSQNILVRTSPSYLKTLGQAHAWPFGAIAELVDNSRDASACRLDISVEYLHLKKTGKTVPVLSVIDDGHGMSHDEIVRMLSLGHKQPDKDDPNHIGRFGIGFKTGAMKLGRDVIILTQTSSSRSVALLSQSLNEDKDDLEIPIITYCRHKNYMNADLNIQSEASARNYMKAIKEFSPFNEYLIGEKFGLFSGIASGTQIYIWNLDEWGEDYTLEWDAKTVEGSPAQSHGDILIRSRRLRSRIGQISQKVPLDYSLKTYLEVIFLDPRMKIYVQGSLVKSRPLAKTLSRTEIMKGHVMAKPVQLTLGRSHEEWERVNSGIFLYWHGRLIEAYKRVGGMVHNADMGRGVIGVLDVSNIMDDGKGHVWVLNNKQGFQDCEAYARLEEWLGSRTDEYWDNNFDTLMLRNYNKEAKADSEWVQCNKCRKWRILSPRFDSKNLPQDWFCYMQPFNGKCETPEEEVEPGVITISAKRSVGNSRPVEDRHEVEEVETRGSGLPGGDANWGSRMKNERSPDQPNKRKRRMPPRT